MELFVVLGSRRAGCGEEKAAVVMMVLAVGGFVEFFAGSGEEVDKVLGFGVVSGILPVDIQT